MDLEGILLSAINQIMKDKYHVIPLISGISKQANKKKKQMDKQIKSKISYINKTYKLMVARGELNDKLGKMDEREIKDSSYGISKLQE